ncbi:glycoside hydrolase family 9 protein [Cellvibrio fibrivorans]|uniref:Endoglucanase n=1 Tax=Cellvibrio fibrivorans TaxID=126350 RepID=A0ABU1V2B0_9GAMM|nr:glycoside hydrolase family 9 protein [Cellvibrio fibrivorans]MDR7091453.1 endoglucanase [Cellvibrio fibrivorans]
MIIRNVLLPASLGLAISLLTACGGSGGGKSANSSMAPSSSSPPPASSSAAASSLPASSVSSATNSSIAAFTGLLIQAEDYVRYYDTTAGNTTGEYRTDGVDIEKSTDTGGGFNIAYIDPGDWLEFSVNVSAAGEFAIESRVATAQAGGLFSYEIDGKTASGEISVAPTGGWQTWASLSHPIGRLEAGNYALCVQMKSGPFNLNWMKITSTNGGAMSLSQTPKGDASSCIHPVEPPKVTVPERIKLNQVGFTPNAEKLAVVPAVEATSFTVLKAGTTEEVMSGTLSAAAVWQPSFESVKLADFSSLTAPGSYELKVAGVTQTAPFTVSADAYKAVNAAALKSFYFNRASTALLETHAGIYQRAAGHADTNVFIHASAADVKRPEGTVVSAPKGWYDAGDYNKYIVNSGITTYTLLAAFKRFPAYFTAQSLNIPESGDAVPDILNEVMWNLEWMLAMQDPDDGGVYHKLTSKGFSGFVMPDADTSERYMVQKSTAATLDFAAVMAAASRVYADYESQYPGLSAKMLAAAKSAWAWAKANPAVYYAQPADIQTGGYGDNNVSDEFFWAAAELYIVTKDDNYYSVMNAAETSADVPGWGGVKSLGWMSLAQHLDSLTAAADKTLIKDRLTQLAAGISTKKSQSAYGVSMETEDFFWGSNSGALNQAMMALEAYQLDTSKTAYRQAAQALFDYVMGRNATDYSFVTGFGNKSPMNIHHRPSGADGIAAPIPGFIAGGPHPDHYSDCGSYPSPLPAKSFVDLECSYSTNEIAINWNAPLVYVSAALQVLNP